MPIKACSMDGKPGYKWGDSGKCYTYTPGSEASKKAAKAKAIKQAVAASYKGGKQVSKVDLADGGIPSSCVCPKCGYKLANPSKHCPELKCPKCGLEVLVAFGKGPISFAYDKDFSAYQRDVKIEFI